MCYLERSIGRAAIHDQMFTLYPLPHGTADSLFKRSGGIERWGNDGEKRSDWLCHEI